MTVTIDSILRDTPAAMSSKDTSALYAQLNGNLTQATSTPVNGASPSTSTLLQTFLQSQKELDNYKKGNAVIVDGHNLSIPAVAAAARHNAQVSVDKSDAVYERLQKSRKVIVDRMDQGLSVYGVSTGYGGSADTRTGDPLRLGKALLQHQHIGVISTEIPKVLPLLDPLTNTSMPESWVRGAILIRMNSLIRGHSGVRMELIEQMSNLLKNQITPLVPLRGSISASGDLSPLSYIAGTVVGNPSIRTITTSPSGEKRIIPSNKALAEHKIEPLPLASKEHLGILNGTAFSASVAALALNDAVHLGLLSQVLTAMGVEALLGTQASFDPFIHAECRPHPGQVESAATILKLLQGSQFASALEEAHHEVGIEQDKYVLRQDRYPLRTAPQFLGPQIEDILHASAVVTLECNTTTDNPLFDGSNNTVHHGGNFQAMAVSNAMEKTRLALHHIGKLLFSQATELVNPMMNRGLPANLAASDPSLNYHTKGVDISMAAYVSELGYLASPVTTHIQSAEMHNQAVNSLALISGRATLTALDTLTILSGTYLYLLCQALDLRALHEEFTKELRVILVDELVKNFSKESADKLTAQCFNACVNSLEHTNIMDCIDRMKKAAESCTAPILEFLLASNDTSAVSSIPTFRKALSSRTFEAYTKIRAEFLNGDRGTAPASKYLHNTRPVYEYVRNTLKVKMHGKENNDMFDYTGIDGLVGMPGGDDGSIGENITKIYEAIRDGNLQSVIVDIVA